MPATTARVLDVYDDIVNYVTGLCHRYHIRSPDSDDLVQEALTAIVASGDTYRSEKGPFDKWARGVARNVIYEYLRKTMQFIALFCECHANVDEYAAAGPSPETSMQQTQARCQITSAAQDLTDQQAEILMLHIVDGMSHKEIGAELDIPEGASQKCYQRARNRMAACVTTDVRCAMPLFETSCNESSSLHHGVSQRINVGKWSHYSGQIAATIIAFLAFVPSNSAEHAHASITGKIPTGGRIAIYQHDKQCFTSDKPVVSPNVPAVKPEPASLPSVRVVSAPTRRVDKPTPTQTPSSKPQASSFKPTLRPVIRRPPVTDLKR